ncbi:hypothetical protein RhiirA4_447237 [Rhizophagus irregularis]|uniref:Uncharacterized protein n=1 Tax=Rhizophagus irregularis TaxID=588596 RepID=A0A2I1H0H8_9GLOM|nr:hypothetical protein RhiirA4_447237 [Rhizophagus irregularis]
MVIIKEFYSIIKILLKFGVCKVITLRSFVKILFILSYASDMIPQFIPYNPNRVPSKAEVEEFDANNEKMKSRLAKEDKTKRAEVDKPVDRLKNYWVIDGGNKKNLKKTRN